MTESFFSAEGAIPEGESQQDLMGGKWWVKATFRREKGRIYISWGFNKQIREEIKLMEGTHWCGADDPTMKAWWYVTDSVRNHFQFAYLMGKNPYRHYDLPLVEFETKRPAYNHQLAMASFIITRHFGVLACEMGTGKTLAMIEAMEATIPETSGHEDIAWYVGPKAGVKAVARELIKWDSRISPRMLTYEGLVKVMAQWQPGNPAPRFVTFDESSRIKTATAQRSQAARALADAVRKEHGLNGYVVLMSGTPAPKSPLDWWNQCEVACPGFLREGSAIKLQKRLAIMQEGTSLAGVAYHRPLAWLDDERRCLKCGKFEDDQGHQQQILSSFSGLQEINTSYHPWTPSENEVAKLYKRLEGLVLVQFKKDCLDLPEKTYEIIEIQPTSELLQAAASIRRLSRTAIQALTLLRELSDGFQYQETVSGKVQCPHCFGRKRVTEYEPVEPVDSMAPLDIHKEDFKQAEMDCPYCGGEGEVASYTRIAERVGSLKDGVFTEELEAHEDVGRYIVWAGFSETIDHLVQLAHQNGWATLCVDGRGYRGEGVDRQPIPDADLLSAMDRSDKNYEEWRIKHPKVCFVGHPKAGGMALTLTASPTELFYSNDFSGEGRMQAEDRAHRPGMDANRGLVIKDIFLLPSDRLVYENLKKKKKLQLLTMTDLEAIFERSN